MNKIKFKFQKAFVFLFSILKILIESIKKQTKIEFLEEYKKKKKEIVGVMNIIYKVFFRHQ